MSAKTTASKRKNDAAIATHQSIQDQIDAFLNAGGEIQNIPNGVSGQTWANPHRASKSTR